MWILTINSTVNTVLLSHTPFKKQHMFSDIALAVNAQISILLLKIEHNRDNRFNDLLFS